MLLYLLRWKAEDSLAIENAEAKATLASQDKWVIKKKEA